MDIGQFYDADDRRRQSGEIELGTEWHDAQGVRYELNWIEDTGELYIMREPPAPSWEDPLGDVYVRTGKKAPVAGMTVVVVGRIETHDQLEQALSGWQETMDTPNSVGWLADRLKDAGVVSPSWALD